jgi:hypothetical protein
VPSFAITDLPQGSIDGCEPTASGWLARQGRRILVLAGLIAGCWLLASILNSAQAKAAPVPAPSTSAAKLSATDSAAKIVHATRPVRALVAAVPTTIRTLPITVQATVAKVATTTHQVSKIVPVIIAKVVHTAPAAGSGPASGVGLAAHRVGVLTRAVPQSTPSSAVGSATKPMAAQARTAQASTVQASTVQASTASQDSATSPAGPQRPTHVPSQAQPGAAGTAAGGQTFGGAATTALTAAFAPTSFMVSAPSSHLAAMLRSTRERPSVSPD